MTRSKIAGSATLTAQDGVGPGAVVRPAPGKVLRRSTRVWIAGVRLALVGSGHSLRGRSFGRQIVPGGAGLSPGSDVHPTTPNSSASKTSLNAISFT